MTEHSLYLYFMDRFIPLNIPLDKVLELAENKPLELFELVKDIIGNEVGRVHDVNVYKKYFDPRNLDVVIEYFVKCDLGKLSFKIVYSKDPAKALIKYYEYEKRVKS